MKLAIPKLNSIIDSGGKVDENFVYFIAFLYSISTGEIGAVEMFKAGKDSKYGKYSEAFQDTYRLGVGWSYGLASSCEMIARKVSDSPDDPTKLLLVKLSQVVRLGDDLVLFFRDELKNALQTFSIKYEANMESQKLFSEMFYTLMSTASFMISANSIMSMLMGFGDSEQILIVSMAGTGGGMAVFVVMMYFTFSRDKLAYSDDDIEKQFRMKMYMGIFPAIGIGAVLMLSGLVPPILAVGLAGIPLLYPGIIAKKEESRISSYTEWYPTFILHFGQLYSTTGAMGTALQAVMRSNFGAIQLHINALKNRIKNRIDQILAFHLFSIDSGNHLVANGNDIFATAVDKGADMNIVGNVIADVTKKVDELRGKRAQNASTFQLVVIILHVLSLSIFGLMNKLTDLFNGLSDGDLSNAAFELSPVNPELMAMLMPVLLIMTSVISGFAIKVIQGGMYKTVFFHIGLLLVIGGVSMFAVSLFMEEFLNGIVFTAPVPGI